MDRTENALENARTEAESAMAAVVHAYLEKVFAAARAVCDKHDLSFIFNGHDLHFYAKDPRGQTRKLEFNVEMGMLWWFERRLGRDRPHEQEREMADIYDALKPGFRLPLNHLDLPSCRYSSPGFKAKGPHESAG